MRASLDPERRLHGGGMVTPNGSPTA